MALMTAPYNSAMRLGMGFNSYTQTLCVNDVVRKPGGEIASEDDLRSARLIASDGANPELNNAKTLEALKPASGDVLQGSSGVIARQFKDGQKDVSQVVTWEASFIENSEDILKKLDVSGALTIKMEGLGGLSGKASFVDSTDIKKADINYLVHVRVTNQRLIGENVTEFSPIPHVEKGQFTDIYGDCFISGFIEGGEFDALISITTENTLKQMHIGGGLELQANFGAVKVEAKAEGSKDDNSTLKNARTQIKVTWSGGGDIRADTIKEWTMQNLKEVAMAFPDAVAACPQRTSAILTKYTSLRSFHEQTTKGSPLDYENAGVYTASLLDAYTDYRLSWKQIQSTMTAYNAKTVQLHFQKPSDGLIAYAKEIQDDQKKKEDTYELALKEHNKAANSNALILRQKESTAVALPERPLPCNAVQPYTADIFGLEKSAKDCRFEMIKIVKEVDAVTKDPQVAVDATRLSQYLSPHVFKMLLPSTSPADFPTFEEWLAHKKKLEDGAKDIEAKAAEIAKMKKELEAALITPMKADGDELYKGLEKDEELHPKVQASTSSLGYQASTFRMQGAMGSKQKISTPAQFFNDLEVIQKDFRPSELRIWTQDGRIKGIKVVYSNSEECKHGVVEGNPTKVLELSADGSEAITELQVQVNLDAEKDAHFVAGIAAATSRCNIVDAKAGKADKTQDFSMADHRQWSFRGFFGFYFDGTFESLGVIWGRDDAATTTSRAQPPPAKNLLGMSASLQEKTKKAMNATRSDEHFYVGGSVSTGTATTDTASTSFNALETITASSRITKLAFSATQTRLSGLMVTYSDGTDLVHGAYTEANKVWSCDVKAPVVAAKLTTAKTKDFAEAFVDTVELVCGDASGQLPLWPLDVSTIRYLGDHKEEEKLEIVSTMAEPAPKLGKANWTLRGFFGEESYGLITRLGLIWGCA